MKKGDAVTRETSDQSPARLRRQGNLRNQHQGCLAHFQRLLDQPYIHLGFARPGYAVDQVR